VARNKVGPLYRDLPEAVQAAAPNAGELDVLAVLWEEGQGAGAPLQLHDIWARVCERRRQFGEPLPAMTTVSTHLRNLVGKKLIEDFTATRPPAAAGQPVQPPRFRGGYTPRTKSPHTSYRALYEPGEVLSTTFRGLAQAYPPAARPAALVDFARAMGLPESTLRALKQLVERAEVSGGGAGAE
jgi:hypothetical protein